MNDQSARKQRIALLSYTTIARDNRILRTLETLLALGHNVTAIGFGEAPALPVSMIRLPDLPSRASQRLTIAATQISANLLPASASFMHMLLPQHRAARAALLRLRPDVVHANDWSALPAADAAKRSFGTRVVYDSHELASEEHADNWRWRLVAQRHVRAIETRFIRRVDAVVTVSEGIASTLQTLYALPQRPLVIYNTPAHQKVIPSLLAEPINLLFHGNMKSGRGIEPLIESMHLLPRHTLTLRGDGTASYLNELRRLAIKFGVSERVTFESALPYNQVITAAARSHIGVFCAPRDTGQNRFAMPNKIYEYIMAGLAVLITAGTELHNLIKDYHCGLAASDSTSSAIATALQELPLPLLSSMRANALAASCELCWETERTKLVALYDALSVSGIDPPPSAGPM